MKRAKDYNILSKIYRKNITHVQTNGNEIQMFMDGKINDPEVKNIHEVTYDIKIWVSEKGYYLVSGKSETDEQAFEAWFVDDFERKVKYYHKDDQKLDAREMAFWDDTEYEAVMKAAKWLYKKEK